MVRTILKTNQIITIMKKTFILLVSAFAIMISACGHSPETISQKEIVKQVNNKLREAASDRMFAPVKTGMYECNDADYRLMLRKLAAAGLVNYDVERYCWWEKSQKNVKNAYTVTHGYYYNYKTTEYKWVKRDVYDFCDHYVVTVSLTKKGERMAVDSLPAPIAIIDKDLQHPEVDESKYAWNIADLSEDWPEIKNPFIAESETEKEAVLAPSAKHEAESKEKASKIVTAERIDSLQFEAFSKLVFDEQLRYLKAGTIKAFKARNIKISDVLTNPLARAEVIVKTAKVTDAGRIVFGLENDERQMFETEFEFFLDKGWQLKDSE